MQSNPSRKREPLSHRRLPELEQKSACFAANQVAISKIGHVVQIAWSG
jgi:hypothetical protein